MVYLQFARTFLKKSLDHIYSFQEKGILLAEAQQAMDKLMVEFSAYLVRQPTYTADERYDLPFVEYGDEKHAHIFVTEAEVVDRVA